VPSETHGHLYENVAQTFSQLAGINFAAFILFACSFVFLLISKKYIKSIP
jgi:hypothetical protein